MDYQWPQSHAEKTDVLKPASPPVGRPFGMPSAQPPPPPMAGDEPTVKIKKPKGAGKPGLRKAGIVAGAVFGALAVVYTLDLIIAGGDVPRGVTVAGVDIGGESRDDAEQALRDAIGPRLTEPVRVKAGDVTTTVDPAKAGLTIDWQGTLDRAGDQPLNPFTRAHVLLHQPRGRLRHHHRQHRAHRGRRGAAREHRPRARRGRRQVRRRQARGRRAQGRSRARRGSRAPGADRRVGDRRAGRAPGRRGAGEDLGRRGAQGASTRSPRPRCRARSSCTARARTRASSRPRSRRR